MTRNVKPKPRKMITKVSGSLAMAQKQLKRFKYQLIITPFCQIRKNQNIKRSILWKISKRYLFHNCLRKSWIIWTRLGSFQMRTSRIKTCGKMKRPRRSIWWRIQQARFRKMRLEKLLDLLETLICLKVRQARYNFNQDHNQRSRENC